MKTSAPAPGAHEPIAPLFRNWHPRYRGALVRVLALSALAAGFGYAENALLQGLAESFRSAASPHGIVPFAARVARPVALPLVLVTVFAFVRALRLWSERRQLNVVGETIERSRADLEHAVLSNLLRKEDAFWAARPVAEVLARLGADVDRVIRRRLAQSFVIQSLLPAAANLAYLWSADPRVAIAAAVASAAGSWWLHRIGITMSEHEVQLTDRENGVSAAVEELLRGAPEIQVDGLFGAVDARVRRAQLERRAAAERSWRSFAGVETAAGVSYVAALAAIFVGIYFMAAPDADTRVALVPVVLKVLPELFRNAKGVAGSLIQLRAARASARRLLEYAVPSPSTTPPPGEPTVAPVRFEGVTYQYPVASGGLQGGVIELSTTLPPDRWIAIVGGSGSGKSTLLQLLLGRLRPQAGTVLLGDRAIPDLSEGERAAAFTLMPQTVLVLDGTIRENIALASGPHPSSEEIAKLLEASGLAALCRGKALDLRPSPSDATGKLGRATVAIRAELRARAVEAGYTLTPYEAGGAGDAALVCEILAGARCPAAAAIEHLLSTRAAPVLEAFARTAGGRRVAETAARLLDETRALLGVADWAAYSRVAPTPMPAPVWALRRAAVERGAHLDLLRVGLTATRGEIAQVPTVDGAELEGVRRLLAGELIPLDPAALHPFLTWRENALFARAELRNRRAGDRLDDLVLAAFRARGAWPDLIERGLDSDVGRGGARLSGGQRQLVALCRALSRDTPVVILDEPTSALDPASRARVVTLLQARKAGRVLVTVTHDPEVMRAADEVRILRDGRLVGSGPFERVEQTAGIRVAGEGR